MKHRDDVPENRLLTALAVFWLLLPVLLFLALVARDWTAPSCFSTRGRVITSTVTIVAYLGLFLIVLWRRRAPWFLAWLIPVALLCSPSFYPWGGVQGPLFPTTEAVWLDGRTGLESRTDVYCNGVHLGRTPLRIEKEDFLSRVQPAEQPAKQERVMAEDGLPLSENGQTAGGLSHGQGAPLNRLPRERTGTRRQAPRLFYEQVPYRPFRELLPDRYWWRFEKEGCAALARPSIALRRVTAAYPEIVFPSRPAHLEHVEYALRRLGYKADEAWVTHVRAYLYSLFDGLVERARREPRLTPSIEKAIRAEFGISTGMTQEDVARTWDLILSRVEEVGEFPRPSPESMAIDLLGQRSTDEIVDLFWKAPVHPVVAIGRIGFSAEAERLYPHYVDLTSRFLPIHYAVNQLTPPSLLNAIAYRSQFGEPFLSMLGNYTDPAAEQLFKYYLGDRDTFPGPGHGTLRREVTRSLSLGSWHMAFKQDLSKVSLLVRNPDVEAFFRRRPIGLEDAGAFIESRLESPRTDLDALAGWVATDAPFFLSPRDLERSRLYWLARVPSKRTPELLERYCYGYTLPPAQGPVEEARRRDGQRAMASALMSRGGRRRSEARPEEIPPGAVKVIHPLHFKEVVGVLVDYPNPFLDEFLCDGFQESIRSSVVPDYVTALVQAMLVCDTDRTRAALDAFWRESRALSDGTAAREVVLEALARLPRFDARLEAWTERLAALDETYLLTLAVEALARTDTPAAWSVLEQWAQDPDAPVRAAAQAQLDAERARAQQSADLIGGRIKPDDLLPPATPYIWTGERYVPEDSAESGDSQPL